jgi:anti-anti-sigma regulatory factor
MDTSAVATRAGVVPRGELVGCLQGDATAMLERLDTRMSDAEQMIISCARLVRIDFSAAGSLLNWAAARQAEGRQLHFIDVHRLVAAFFNVVGLSGLSGPVRVSVRRD